MIGRGDGSRLRARRFLIRIAQPGIGRHRAHAMELGRERDLCLQLGGTGSAERSRPVCVGPEAEAATPRYSLIVTVCPLFADLYAGADT